jgi:hypothetical protein
MKTVHTERFSSRWGVALGLAAVCTLTACAMPEPWVKPYERERLADPVMKVQRDPLSAKHFEHAHEVREGARGGTGVQGGGCGCN